MTIMERQIKHLRVGGLDTFLAQEKEFDAVESALGFPQKRHYVSLAGEDWDSVVMEREWPSLAEYEAAHVRIFESAEWQAVLKRATERALVDRARTELYWCPEG